MIIQIYIGLLIVTLYILAGYYWCDALYNDMQLITNPLYKPIVVLFWIPVLLVVVVYILFLRPLINWIKEIKNYYKRKD